MSLKNFTLSFVETLLWSELDEHGNPLGDGLSIDDIDPETLAAIERQCEAFWIECRHLFTLENVEHPACGSVSEMAGHDFALTRNGHGAGFWDGDWAEPVATTLTAVAERYGESSLYIGDDGKLYAYQSLVH